MSTMPWIWRDAATRTWYVPTPRGTIAWSPVGRSSWCHGPYKLAREPDGFWYLYVVRAPLRAYHPSVPVTVAIYRASHDVLRGVVAPDYDADPAVMACGL